MRYGNLKAMTAMSGAAMILGLAALTGCNNNNAGGAAAGGGGAGGDKSASAGAGGAGGDQLVQAKCNCHNGGGRAPSLASIGAKHNEGWLAEFIADPKSKDPGSRMPSMAGKVTPEEIATIAKYLASQK